MANMDTVASTSVLTLFQAFSDSYRLQIIELLREQELCACDIAQKIRGNTIKAIFSSQNLA